MSRAAVALMSCLCWRIAAPGPAHAQDFTFLRVRAGQIVRVTEAGTGVRIIGPVTSVTRDAIRVGDREFAPGAGLKIERRGDALWNGALIGFGLGTLVLYPIVPEFVPPRGRSVRPANGLVWAAIGALIDRVHVGHTTIYDGSSDASGRSVRLVPDVAANRKGAALVVRF
jgi:hypothetical protein